MCGKRLGTITLSQKKKLWFLLYFLTLDAPSFFQLWLARNWSARLVANEESFQHVASSDSSGTARKTARESRSAARESVRRAPVGTLNKSSFHRLIDRRLVVFSCQQLPVFMWRSHVPKFKIAFPSEVLVSSDYRPYRNLAFYNVLARQGSSFCNRARLNFQAFALRD